MKGIIPSTKKFLTRNSATILSILGSIGVVATAVTAIKATPKALRLIEQEEKAWLDGCIDPNVAYIPLTNADKIKLTWKCYIPTALMGTATIACIIGSNVLNKRNQASLISAYAMLHESYKQYRGAAKEVYGEDADKKIMSELAKETWVSQNGMGIYYPDADDSEKLLFYDVLSNRYFNTTMGAVINAQYHVNRNLSLRGDVSANEFYNFLGIPEIGNGDTFGWEMGAMVEDGYMWLDFENHRTKLDDGMECYIISADADTVVFD